MVMGISPSVVRAVSKAQCMTNMRNLHVAFASYVNEAGHWPQQPDDLLGNDEMYDLFWTKSMYPYTQSDKVWTCPLLQKAHLQNTDGKEVKVHYLPTKFDLTKQAPYRWPGQPWLIEIANAHGQGPLILFPDGSIKSLGEILKKN